MSDTAVATTAMLGTVLPLLAILLIGVFHPTERALVITHIIDIVGKAQRGFALSERVHGELQIALGDQQREEQIRAMYRQTDEAVYTLLTGELPPRTRNPEPRTEPRP